MSLFLNCGTFQNPKKEKHCFFLHQDGRQEYLLATQTVAKIEDWIRFLTMKVRTATENILVAAPVTFIYNSGAQYLSEPQEREALF